MKKTCDECGAPTASGCVGYSISLLGSIVDAGEYVCNRCLLKRLALIAEVKALKEELASITKEQPNQEGEI